MDAVSLPACAKVNLHLSVLGRRPDGCHELLTLFERVDLADELTVERTAGGGIELLCDSPVVPSDRTNLAVRAAEEFRRASGWTDGLRIRLTKKIPAGGGLGGGSSDAAVVLKALQRLSGGALSPERLMECARRLGADVSFFAADVPWALGRDRGDRIEPLSLKANLWHLLVTPEFSIPTKNVYEAFRLSDGPRPAEPLLEALGRGKVSSVRPLLYNALEPAVEGLYPQIRAVKSEMKSAGLERVMVSGSGSTLFALCASKGEAEESARRLRESHPFWKVHAASTV